MLAYPWPGNIRELESTVSRAALTSPGRIIRDSDVEFLHPHTEGQLAASPRMPTLADAERTHISRVLEAAGWNKKEAARVSWISAAARSTARFSSTDLDPKRSKRPESAHEA